MRHPPSLPQSSLRVGTREEGAPPAEWPQRSRPQKEGDRRDKRQSLLYFCLQERNRACDLLLSGASNCLNHRLSGRQGQETAQSPIVRLHQQFHNFLSHTTFVTPEPCTLKSGRDFRWTPSPGRKPWGRESVEGRHHTETMV